MEQRFALFVATLCKMHTMDKLRVQFGDPEHGWIQISVSDGIHTVVVDVDSKFHAFQGLTTALLGLFNERGQYKVWWFEEPIETEWKFVKQKDEIAFQFRRSIYPEPVFEFTGSYEEVCLPFWRALRSLTGRFEPRELEKRTYDEFPFSELERLTAQIQAMKSQT